MDAFLEDFKSDLLRSKYSNGSDILSLDSKVTERRIWQLTDREQYGLYQIEEQKAYKVLNLKLDLACVSRPDVTLGEVLELLFIDFERTFFSRTEGGHEVLPKRVIIARNGIEISLLLDSDAEMTVISKEKTRPAEQVALRCRLPNHGQRESRKLRDSAKAQVGECSQSKRFESCESRDDAGQPSAQPSRVPALQIIDNQHRRLRRHEEAHSPCYCAGTRVSAQKVP